MHRLVVTICIMYACLVANTVGDNNNSPIHVAVSPHNPRVYTFGCVNEEVAANFSTAIGAPVNENVGNAGIVGSSQNDDNNQGITNGNDAYAGKYPYVGILLVKYYGYYFHVCSVVIYNRHMVITAARCLYYISYYDYYVGVGVKNLTLGLDCNDCQFIKVDHYTIHPGYDPNAPGDPNDIAALHLDCLIEYRRHIQPAHLASRYDGRFEHQYCHLVGWGYDGNGYPAILQEARTKAIENYLCRLFWLPVYYVKINPKQICDYNYPVSSCIKDEGGPLVCNGKVVGIISWRSADCSGCFAGVNTRVSRYLKWIRSVARVH